MIRFVVCSLSLLVAGNALALGTYPAQLPNGTVNSCSTCHNNPNGGGARNPFGVAAQASTPNGTGVSWAAFCADDADDDGFSNGEELGDPDCVWAVGDAPASTENISLPGDSESIPGVGEGEGEAPVGEGEGEAPVGEGEGEAPVGEGEGEAPVGEGEGEAAAEGEGEGGGEPIGCSHNDNGSGNALLGGAFLAAAVIIGRRRR